MSDLFLGTMSRPRFMLKPLSAAIATFLLTLSSQAVVQGLAVPDSDSRFDAVGLVITVAGDGSTCGGFISGTGTLITHDLVMLARHSVAQLGGPLPTAPRTHRIRFRRSVSGGVSNHFTDDCASPFQEISVAEFIESPSLGLDMVLGRLESSPIGITPIPADPGYVPVGHAEVILAGWGYDGLCFESGDHWTLRTKSAQLPSDPYTSSCCFIYNESLFNSGCVSQSDSDRWAIGNLHDSGAPLLFTIMVDGQPKLRVGGIVNSTSWALPVSVWNSAGGQPALATVINCSADFNGTGIVSVQDLFDYLAAYFNGTTDSNGLGTVSAHDIFVFMQAYFAGCP